MKNTLNIPQKPARNFIPENLNLDEWNEVEPLLKDLVDRNISTKEEFNKLLGELYALLSDNLFKKQKHKFKVDRPHLYRTKKKGAQLVLAFLAKYIQLEGGESSEISIDAIVNAIGDGELDVVIVVLDTQNGGFYVM